MPDRSDFTSGETTPVGARVDSGIYEAFREWVEQQTGKQYNEVGDALERAMLEYMDKDRYYRIERDVSEIQDQTCKNEALIRKVINRIDDEKERPNSNSNSDEPPAGKDPGSRRKREAHVVRGLLLNDMHTVRLETLEEAIREFAAVSSDKTIDGYVTALTKSQVFQSSQTPNTWRLDHDGAREFMSRQGIEPPTKREVRQEQ